MGMPSEDELRLALAAAAVMRETGQDPHHVAKALLNLNYRCSRLEKVVRAAELFLRSGMAVREHQQLKKALEEYRRAVTRTAGKDTPGSFGL